MSFVFVVVLGSAFWVLSSVPVLLAIVVLFAMVVEGRRLPFRGVRCKAEREEDRWRVTPRRFLGWVEMVRLLFLVVLWTERPRDVIILGAGVLALALFSWLEASTDLVAVIGESAAAVVVVARGNPRVDNIFLDNPRVDNFLVLPLGGSSATIRGVPKAKSVVAARDNPRVDSRLVPAFLAPVLFVLSSFILRLLVLSSFILRLLVLSSFILLFFLLSSFILLFFLLSSFILLLFLLSSFIFLLCGGEAAAAATSEEVVEEAVEEADASVGFVWVFLAVMASTTVIPAVVVFELELFNFLGLLATDCRLTL